MKNYILGLLLLMFSTANLAADPVLCNEMSLPAYDGMTLEEVAATMNDPIYDKWLDCVDRNLLLDQIETADWAAQTNTQKKADFLAVFGSAGCVNPKVNGFAYRLAVDTFPGTVSLTKMADVSKIKESRASQLGLGEVTVGKLQKACN